MFRLIERCYRERLPYPHDMFVEKLSQSICLAREPGPEDDNVGTGRGKTFLDEASDHCEVSGMIAVSSAALVEMKVCKDDTNSRTALQLTHVASKQNRQAGRAKPVQGIRKPSEIQFVIVDDDDPRCGEHLFTLPENQGGDRSIKPVWQVDLPGMR